MDNRIDNKLDKLDERLDTIATVLTRNTVSLEEHIRRTKLLEDRVVPIEKHVFTVGVIVQIGSVTVAGLLAARTLGIL